jgi:hypothetical protein
MEGSGDRRVCCHKLCKQLHLPHISLHGCLQLLQVCVLGLQLSCKFLQLSHRMLLLSWGHVCAEVLSCSCCWCERKVVCAGRVWAGAVAVQGGRLQHQLLDNLQCCRLLVGRLVLLLELLVLGGSKGLHRSLQDNKRADTHWQHGCAGQPIWRPQHKGMMALMTEKLESMVS